MEIKLNRDDIKVLAAAIIYQAGRDYYLEPKNYRDQKIKKEAERWLNSENGFGVSFADCCTVLGITKEQAWYMIRRARGNGGENGKND